MLKRFTNEEKKWLAENYPLNESREETFLRFTKEFGNNHSYSSVISYCKEKKIHKPKSMWKYQKGNTPWTAGLSKKEIKKHFSKESFKKMTTAYKKTFKNIKERNEYNVPNGMVLSDLGNGKKIIMDKKIYKCMQTDKALGRGEITETIYLIYLVKRELEKQLGKRIMRNLPQCQKKLKGEII